MVRMGREKPNMMRRSIMSTKVMKWICNILKEASKEQPRLVTKDLSNVNVTGESKWHSDIFRVSLVSSSKGDINVTVPRRSKDTVLFKRCIVASFPEGETESPTISHIKR
ncbi:hypothetical protein MTR67_011889 [Solanum verrucosum]|uniref:Uncharacterized protein n=1 Tax=Solanum verrucosum TaxID=315347 RepID=A0AAF0TH05_SOLVR|nr:hypothetical protein MTR67_011889 [Solanum verrucosum]